MANSFEDIMQQAQKMQSSIQESGKALEKIRISGESGAGLVKVIINGNGDALELNIDNSVYEEDRQVMKGLIISAMNDAQHKKQRAKEGKMQEIISSFNLPPGMKLPFMSKWVHTWKVILIPSVSIYFV